MIATFKKKFYNRIKDGDGLFPKIYKIPLHSRCADGFDDAAGPPLPDRDTGHR